MANRLRIPDEVLGRLREAGADLDVRTLPDRRRAYRDQLAVVEIRQGSELEIRDVERRDDGTEVGRFVGFSTSYGQPYDIYGGPGAGGFTEIMADGSWTRTIGERVDIHLLENHEGRPFARVGNDTLLLSEPGLGVLNEAMLDLRRTDARDLYLTLERGDYCKMSCAFMVMRDKWNASFTQRTILEVVGFDSSVVTFPANANTLAMVGDATPKSPSGRSLALVEADWRGLAG